MEHIKKCKVQNDEDLNLSMSTSTKTTINCTSTSHHDDTPEQFNVNTIFRWET